MISVDSLLGLRRACAFNATVLCAALLGCGEADDTPPPLCPVETQELPNAGEFHAELGTALTFDSNPPASGTHYPLWGHWGRHTEVLERGYYVHNLEHGGVVLLYNCATPCPDIEAALSAIMDERPRDPICFSSLKNRMVLTADPLLDVRVAAAAWQHIYRADCVDAPSLRKFIDAHYAHAPEQTCTDGQVP